MPLGTRTAINLLGKIVIASITDVLFFGRYMTLSFGRPPFSGLYVGLIPALKRGPLERGTTMARFGPYCKTCGTIFFRFDIPFSLSKLYSKKKERMVHHCHHVDIISLDSMDESSIYPNDDYNR